MPCRIVIPAPCHEDWSQMSPAEKGRHCAACNKTVVDFSRWSLGNIADYIRKHRAKSICGHFSKDQLNVEIPYTPGQWVEQVAATGLSLLQKLALIFLLAFGLLTSACNTHQTGQSAHAGAASSADTPAKKELTEYPHTVGMISLPDTNRHLDLPLLQASPKKHRVKKPGERLKGDVMIAPVKTLNGGVPVLEDDGVQQR